MYGQRTGKRSVRQCDRGNVGRDDRFPVNAREILLESYGYRPLVYGKLAVYESHGVIRVIIPIAGYNIFAEVYAVAVFKFERNTEHVFFLSVSKFGAFRERESKRGRGVAVSLRFIVYVHGNLSGQHAECRFLCKSHGVVAFFCAACRVEYRRNTDNGICPDVFYFGNIVPVFFEFSGNGHRFACDHGIITVARNR